MAQDNNREVIYGLYDDEEDLLRAVKLAKTDHLDIYDVFSPFPVHGLDPLLGLEESRLHQAGFIYGALGTMTAFLGMSWIFTKDWP
ncbi:MAG: quinol:electron acceptor oxidoreductase subunit ActD, partial [Saprospiraceae bacterium]